jgi:ATP-dependent DNA ligase
MRSQSALIEPPRGKGVVFVGPMLVAQISFQEWTADRKRREAVLPGLCDDKTAQDVLLPGPAA